MIQAIKYEQKDNFISVGFKKYNFVVYGQRAATPEYTKTQYLQSLYEQCKNAIDYETKRYIEGKSNSIITNEEGEEFIPELAKLKSIELVIDNSNIQFTKDQENITIELKSIAKDQYKEDISADVIYTSTLGIVSNDNLIISNVGEPTEVAITASSCEVIDIKIINLFPYVELSLTHDA